jgi:deoxyribodipyrimidine photo-lyase
MNAAFPVTRAAALARWQDFILTAPAYGAARNHVLPGHDNVSRLSAAIRHRVVLREELLAALFAAHPFERVEKLAQELLWRDYWRAWLALRPAVWRDWVDGVARARAELAPAPASRLAAIEAGASGMAVMDGFARELVETGYLHNHARMWFASWWVHVERLPWQLGAAFFLRHLVDADAASNTLSWRWVAGLHTAGKRYLVRRSNVEKYLHASLRADTRGLDAIDDAAIAAIEAASPPPRVLHPEPLDAAAALPADDALPPATQRWGLWIHDEDGCAEQSPLRSLAPAALIATFDAVTATGLSQGTRRQACSRAALQDALARARQHYGSNLPHEFFAGGVSEHWPAAVARTAAALRLDGIIALRPGVGPLADQLAEARALWQGRGLALRLVGRDSDRIGLRHARGGYFGYWSRVASSLR